jgi:phage-related protein
MSSTTGPTSEGERKKPDKPLFFIGSSLRDLRAFPLEVKRMMGFAFRQAQGGGKHHTAKPLKGHQGGGVLEVVTDHATDTFRGVYTVRYRRVVYVLHAFQKKSKTGKKTPKHETGLVQQRLRVAEEHYAEWLKTHPAEGDAADGDAE